MVLRYYFILFSSICLYFKDYSNMLVKFNFIKVLKNVGKDDYR